MPPMELSETLREYTVPLETTDPSTPPSKHIPEKVFGNAMLVGLGEATHGTREFVRLKHRLIRHLVERRGFRTLAIEAGLTATLAADDYVFEGRGTTETALRELDKWQWQSAAVGELLQWLRSFNEGRSPDDRVRIRGIDLNDPSKPADRLQSSFERLDLPWVGADDMAAIAALADSPTGPVGEKRREAAVNAVRAVQDGLSDGHAVDSTGEREQERERTREREQERVRHLCRAVEQACEWAPVRHAHDGPHPEGMAVRDSLMAQNAERALELDHGEGIIAWAHDGHVQRGTFDDGSLWADVETMGEHLTAALGSDYRPVGFDFARGSVCALPSGGTAGDGPRAFSIDDPPEESATASLDTLDCAPYLLRVAAASDSSRLESLLDRPQRLRYVGSVYDSETPQEAFRETVLSESFDELVFVPESTPVRLLD
ncbi:erythromycin esterase family protein [Halogeometricum borinquense]|uniref:Erythromycin esterase family protein n=2 Tax=Halogeometricum borinquense TaxID=60847 RepID=A0A482T8G0_9EURY|nr:erythromycin esterase family protein [Halogeometricum borinquense]